MKRFSLHNCSDEHWRITWVGDTSTPFYCRCAFCFPFPFAWLFVVSVLLATEISMSTLDVKAISCVRLCRVPIQERFVAGNLWTFADFSGVLTAM